MNCAQVKEQLVDYLYGELSAPARSAFVEHLRGCPGCNAEVAGHEQALSHARAALTGPLLQEPPARLRLAVMEAAKVQARSLRRAEGEDRPGFLSRLLRTPWLLPAFGAASVATVVFLVRVLKNPEMVPGQVPAPVFEESQPAVGPGTPAPLAAPATAEPAAELRSRAVQPISPHEAAKARRHASAAAGKRGAPEPARNRRAASRGLPADLLRGAGTASSKESAGFAEPPPLWDADRKADRSMDDLMGSVKRERVAPPPAKASAATPRARPAAVRDEESVHGRPPVSAESIAEKKMAESPSRPASPMPNLAAPQPEATPSSFAPPPPAPAAPAPTYAPPPKSRRADMDMAEGEAAAWEPSDKDLAEKRAPAGRKSAGLSLEESVRKADRLYASRDWTAAAAAYGALLTRFPKHQDAAKWRARMNQSLVAEEQARNPNNAKAGKAAKAKTNDVLLKDMK